MKIKDFLKTETGAKFNDDLEGCSGEWQVEHWNNMGEYIQCLQDNNWNDDDIQDQLLNLALDGGVFWQGDEFVVVIN